MLQLRAEAVQPVRLRRRGVGVSRGAFHIVSVGLLLTTDTLMTLLAFVLAYHIRFQTDLVLVQHITPWSEYAQMMAVTVVTLLATLALRGQYASRRGVSSVDIAWSIAGGVSIAVTVSVALTTLLFKFDYPRAALVVAWGMAIVFLFVVRLAIRQLGRLLHATGHALSHVIVVGTGTSAQSVIQRMQQLPHLGYRVVGLVDANPHTWHTRVAGCPVLGDVADLPDLVRRFRVDEVLLAMPSISAQELMRLVASIPSDSVDVKLVPDLLQLTTGALTVDDLAGMPLMTVKRGALRAWDRFMKRTVDVLVSASALVMLSPFMLLVALLVKVTSPGPVFYGQQRVGYNGQRFTLLKFRSMRLGADAPSRPAWTVRGDPRRTWIGKLLRRHSIDEMPQFLNVLAGQMSIVGPRPEQPAYVERFAQTIYRYMDRHQEKSGMTGWAQVNGLRGDTPIDERTRYDLYYVDNWSLLLDFKIMLMTLRRLVFDDKAQ